MKAKLFAILRWLKTNAIVVISLFFCLASIGGLYYVYALGSSFVADVNKRTGEAGTLDALFKTNVKLPPDKPNEPPPPDKVITVNPKAIEEVKGVFDKMGGEFTSTRSFAEDINHQNHVAFMDELFPEPSEHTAQVSAAKRLYGKALLEMLQPYSAAADYPQLDARPGLSQAEVKTGLDEASRDFLANLGKTSGMALTPDESDKLQKAQADKMLEMLLNHAKTTHLYAQTDANVSGFPLDVPTWVRDRSRPSDSDLWEGQMILWITGDIARVIALTNRVENPDTNVIVAPIKRLVRIHVIPGYAGAGAPPTDNGSAAYAPHFDLSSTGRASTGLYDIRYVDLDMIVDWKRLPAFFDALAQVNFMTVVNMQVSDVDAYQALNEKDGYGYVYGSGDPVEVDMIIETVWFRGWMKKLMPMEVQIARGMAPGKPVAGAFASQPPKPNPAGPQVERR